MKLVLAISSLGAGGAERVATTLANAWTERGDEVTLVATFSGKGDECFYPISEAVRVVYLADLAKRRGRSLLAYWARFWALRKLVRDINPDVVVSFLTNVNVAVIAACRGLRIPVIVSERVNPLAENELGALLRWFRRISYPLADVVTVQTQDIVEPLRAVCPGIQLLAVVPNPIPRGLEKYQRDMSVRTRRPRIAAMGRFTHQKQFGVLVSLFSTLAAKHPRWDLWIWGDGPLHKDLQRQIRDFGLVKRVFLPGRTSQPWNEMASSDIFVLTSRFEGFPNVLLEAMAIGLPCVAFDCPSGPREISRNGMDALLVPHEDTASFIRQLDELMGSPAMRRDLGARAAQSARTRYSLSRVLTTWDEVFRMGCTALRGTRS